MEQFKMPSQLQNAGKPLSHGLMKIHLFTARVNQVALDVLCHRSG